ncbi:hypothetical protein GH714_009018 [Hevea brasiliensis]|uniref:Uncharacterized protein n=1 Tax=Hevea brasiliensis TaxID=3981 RepID=A0A6A6L0L5_HEVBR|nr:hypothetical protein GH714_009018 [Hevea brasiliensis]
MPQSSSLASPAISKFSPTNAPLPQHTLVGPIHAMHSGFLEAPSAFSCAEFEFYLHTHCANLPSTVVIDAHAHELKLTFDILYDGNISLCVMGAVVEWTSVFGSTNVLIVAESTFDVNLFVAILIAID